jgi:hypothetical protein
MGMAALTPAQIADLLAYEQRDKRRGRKKGVRRQRDYLSHRATNLKKLYGITIEDYDELYNKQNGLCAICGGEGIAARELDRVLLHVDHCHETGKVRGLLCRRCNHGIALLGDNVEGLERALKYLSQT